MTGHPEKVTTQRYPAVGEVASLSSEFVARSVEQIDTNWTSAKCRWLLAGGPFWL